MTDTPACLKTVFHLLFFKKAGEKTKDFSKHQDKFYQSPKNCLANVQERVQHSSRAFQMTINIGRNPPTSRNGQRSPQLVTLLSSFFIVTRSKDLSECPVGVMKYRQT